ncbi:ATP-dependent zinc metalloprotease FtsH [Phytohabitans rumicis]|uniref:ATP-dependent zinc metalloprotease FtsH n=1 Tax=Phytohabitans rumicis TaxID=1076125 RepID=A0A6V8L9Q9_9ACTN|nr:ATP-dependent zinc metalloprotease FtsH [Phytohabitans rumicis]GFJ92350.1 ATP-dependent zinc metalloprotease FtsH [Phytohabitans rumicis]
MTIDSRKPPGAPRGRPAWRRWLIPAGLVLTLALLIAPTLLTTEPAHYTYSEFVTQVEAGHVKQVSINDEGAVDGKLTGGRAFSTQLPTALGSTGLEQDLRAHNVTITATRSGFSWWTLLGSFAPLVLLVGLFWWTGRRAARGIAEITGPGGFGGIGRARAKVIDTERPSTRFSDVAGYDAVKQEISEVVDYLRRPERYQALGATGPRGVLLVGPPGTGKTLLARAVAGEARVPFLSVSGSGFVEMFVGVGASRVRDLFADARRRAPSIIFIDEIDALGARRGGLAVGGGNDEREQTLNQMLAEMDGFDQAGGVVVIAATNRPDTLDAALLRPGRFDRQVTVGLPAQRERTAILTVHARGKPVGADVDFDVVSRATPGFSGADLANLVNEAAIHAVRDGRTQVGAADFDAARDRILLGHRESSNLLLPEEKLAVAIHESGHALVAAVSPHADPVAKVTILPAGMALGATEQLPDAERHLYGEAYLLDSLAVRMGGRAAELLVLGEASTGAANDLASATGLAQKMVREFGLSPALGPVGYPAESGSGFLPGGAELSRPFSESTQRRIDEEVARLLREAEERALDLLRRHRRALDALTSLLQEQETVDGKAVRRILEASGQEDSLRR